MGKEGSANSLHWFRSPLEHKVWSGRDGSDANNTGAPWWAPRAALDREAGGRAAFPEQDRTTLDGRAWAWVCMKVGARE